MRRIPFNSESGVILPIVIILMVALTITGIAFLGASVLENKLVTREVYKNQAFHLADAGIEHLRVKLSILGGHQEIRDQALVGGGSEGGDYQPAVGGTHVSRLALGEGGYWVEYYDAAPYAISIGQVIEGGSISAMPDLGEVIEGGETIAQRKIKIMLLESPLFDYLIFGDEWVDISGNSSVAYVPGTERGKVGTNGTTDGALAVSGSAEVIADVYIVDDPEIIDDAEVIIEGIDKIAGDVDAGPPIELPAVTEPSGLTSYATPLNILPGDDISLLEDSEYPSVDVKGILRIPEHSSRILMANTLTISGGGEIRIETGADLKIYVKEDARLEGHGITNVDQNPLSCQIYGIGECTIYFRGTEDFYGTMYAPDGDITCRGDAKIQGSLIGNTVDVNGNPMVWWDPTLGTGGPTKTSLTNWQEIS